jgi:hypothetical protein
VPGGYLQLHPNVSILCYDGNINSNSKLLHIDHYDIGKNGKKIDLIVAKNTDVWLNHYQW